MRADVTFLDLRLRRRSLLGYTTGMALYTLVIVALYPQFKNSLSLDQLTRHGSAVAALFGATGTLTSPAGWLNANIYANFLPLIMLLITVGYGAACIASGQRTAPVPDRGSALHPNQHPAPEDRQPHRPGRPDRRRHHDLRSHRPRFRPGHPGGRPRRSCHRDHPGRHRLRPDRPGDRVLDRKPGNGTGHRLRNRRRLVPDQLPRTGRPLAQARQVRIAPVLVGRQQPAHQRADSRLGRGTRRRRHHAASPGRARIPPPRPPLTRR